MTQNTHRFCKGYLNKKVSDGVLYDMTNLNHIHVVCDYAQDTTLPCKPRSYFTYSWEIRIIHFFVLHCGDMTSHS